MPDEPQPPTRKRAPTAEAADGAAPPRRARAPRAGSGTGAAASARAARVAKEVTPASRAASTTTSTTKKRAPAPAPAPAKAKAKATPAAAKAGGGVAKRATTRSATAASRRTTPVVEPEVVEAPEPVVESPLPVEDQIVEPVGEPIGEPFGEPAGLVGEPSGEPAPAPRTRPWMIGAIAGAVATIGLLIALILTMLQLNDANALDSARSSALTAAQTYATQIAGYDYRHLDDDFAAVLANSTPSFKESFTKSSNALKSTLIKYKATAVAKVVSAGVVSATTGQVVVLVFLDQTVNNTNQKAPTTDRSQIEMTLVSSSGRWLIDQVTLI